MTEMDDLDHAIKRQINHSLGPSTVFKKIGYRSSLGHNYNTQIINVDTVEKNLKRVEYIYRGTLLVEQNINLETYKVIVPIRAKQAFSKARGRCSKKSSLALFYQAWSPHYRRCPLVKDMDYAEFKLDSYTLVNHDQNHLSKSLTVNGKYNLFYYNGSDFHSLRRFGFAKSATNLAIKSFLKRGFKKVYKPESVMQIFSKDKTISRFTHLLGHIRGVETNVYILLGNPTEQTPIARYEYFKFIKSAFETGSSIQYNGHAGLGSVLDLDYLETIYNEKINYNQNQKQLVYLNGCSTFIHSTGFFFKKKNLSNSLILITNGLSILTKYNKAPSLLIGNILYNNVSFTNRFIRSEINQLMKRDGAQASAHALVAVESN